LRTSPVRIESIGWERPQLVVRISAGPGGPEPDPDTFALVRADRPEVVMPPTGSRQVAGSGALVLRFNVLVGPGVRPLGPGRWSFVHRDVAKTGPRPVAAPDADDLAAAAREFATPGGTYRVTPIVEPVTGGLAIDVALETKGRPPSLVTRSAGRLRSAGWMLVFGVMKVAARRKGRRVLFVTGSRSRCPAT